MTPDDFRKHQARLAMTDAELAEALGRSENMIRRYKAKGARGRPIPDEVADALICLAPSVV